MLKLNISLIDKQQTPEWCKKCLNWPFHAKIAVLASKQETKMIMGKPTGSTLRMKSSVQMSMNKTCSCS